MPRSQSLILVAAGIIAAIIFVLLTVYFGAFAAGHPRAKHMLLFIVLAVVSLLVAWFAYPKRAVRSA
jgi:uncharacterized membrane protein